MANKKFICFHPKPCLNCKKDMAKKRITQREAKEKYGIVVSKMQRYNKVKCYLLENGSVVDSDGDIRYEKPKQKKKQASVRLDDAQHPIRQKAIAVLEMLIGASVFKKEPKNELWYQLEDAITEIIAKKI